MPNIIVVFPKIQEAKGIRNLLVRSGYEVAAAVTSGAQALSMADNLGSGIIVSGYMLADGIFSYILENKPKGFEMLLVVSQAKAEECAGMDVLTLTMPLKTADFLRSVDMLMANMARERKRRRSIPKKRDPEEQKIIDDAKAVLMEKHKMTESEAHRYLQKNSMDSGNTMVEYAKMVLQILYRE